jgi:hypothetical protein
MCLLGVVIGSVIGFVGTPIIALTSWGQRQAISATKIERTVRRGMSPDEVAYALGEPPDAFDSCIKACPGSDPTAQYVLTVSRSGLGSYFVPQHNIWLYLDKNKQVTLGIDKVIYQLDEQHESIPLGQ